MGCTSSREKLESKMLILKLKSIEIKQEREERIKALEKITGKHIQRKSIPDYIEKSNDRNDDMDSDRNSDANTGDNQKENIIVNKKRFINFQKESNEENESDENENQSFENSQWESENENERNFHQEKNESENLSSQDI